jgi:polysaccharide pyruvyl transferase WcaK-like protein
VKILVAGASTFGVKNLGDDAILSCLVLSIRAELPEAEISILLRHADPDYGSLFGLRVMKNFDHDNAKSAKGRFFLGLNEGDPRGQLVKISNEIGKSDLLVIAGNSLMALSEPTVYRGVSSYATLVATIAMLSDTPYVLWGLNVVEPLENSALREQARFLIGGAHAVSVRESAAHEHISNAVNVANPGKITIGNDPAWGLDEKEVDRVSVDRLIQLTGYGNLQGGQFMTMNLRAEYWADNAKDEEQIRLGLEVFQWARESGLEVLLVPNCTYSSGALLQDDREFHRVLLERASFPPHVHSIENELNVFETVKMFSFSKAHVTNRRHSAFFAAMNSVPTVVLSTSLVTHNTGWFAASEVEGNHFGIIHTRDDVEGTLTKFVSEDQIWAFPNIESLRRKSRKAFPDVIKGIGLREKVAK